MTTVKRPARACLMSQIVAIGATVAVSMTVAGTRRSSSTLELLQSSSNIDIYKKRLRPFLLRLRTRQG